MRAGQQVAPRRGRRPADPAPQLVELGDAEAVGVLDHHDRGVGDVDAHLDHRRGDQHVERAGTERGHHRFLFLRRQLPVQQTQAQAGKHLDAEPFVLLGRRAGLDPLRLLDQWADDVGLVAGGDLVADPLPRPPSTSSGPRAQVVVTGVRPGRQLVEHGGVEVAVDGHRRRARDRGGRHDQHVGDGALGPLGPEGGPLLDAEAVLLVDHHDAEGAEGDRLAQQGVGADQDVDGAVGQPGVEPGPLRARWSCW